MRFAATDTLTLAADKVQRVLGTPTHDTKKIFSVVQQLLVDGSKKRIY